ncbi:MAG: cell wall hydrolase [Pseudomonadota bacterium]
MLSPPSFLAAQPWLTTALALIAGAAIGLPLIVVTNPPVIARAAPPRVAPRIVPQAELPPVEPVAFRNLPPDEARAFNETVPFSTGPNPAARPFKLAGLPEDRVRAIDCMAAAMLYEAGDDPVGERAVGQVVINRARHPAFPKTICGVVFQGQERTTGCQFTFTCDGAILRAPNPEAWTRAQALAEQALTGRVFAAVGHSTHYHTDWVVPYWQSSLDKVARVHTHLFFRWTGWWGTPPAFRRAVSAVEPVIEKLAGYSPAHAPPALDEAAAAVAEANAALTGDSLAPVDPDVFLLTIDRKLAPDLLPAFAKRACGDRDYCKLMGWSDKAQTPPALPLTPSQQAAMTFSYLRDRARGYDKPLWNCATYPRIDVRECMKVQMMMPARPAASFRLEQTPGAAILPGATPAPAKRQSDTAPR